MVPLGGINGMEVFKVSNELKLHLSTSLFEIADGHRRHYSFERAFLSGGGRSLKFDAMQSSYYMVSSW